MNRDRFEALIVLLASLALLAWYASAQWIYALYGPYQLLRLFFPGLLASAR